MNLVTHHHSFLQYIELGDIQSKINIVRGQIFGLESKVSTKIYTLLETQIEYLNTKLNKVNYQLESLEPHRSKRGLVDGLGSVIKSLIGNLDYTDAIKYSNAIKTLQGNQNKINSQVNKHISLSKDWMKEHKNIVESMLQN